MAVLSRAVLCIVALSLIMLADGQASTDNSNGKGTTSVFLPSTDECGKRGGRFKRIVGGSDAEPGMFPWIAALGFRTANDSHTNWMCVGSLVTDRHLVTVADCAAYPYGGYVLSMVRLGVLDLNDTNDATRTDTDYEVDTLTVHPGFSSTRPINNIAIIKLKKKVTFSRFIQPICFPALSEFRTTNFTGSTGYIAGWGRTDFAGPVATRLQQAEVRVWDQKMCKKVYERQNRVVIDNKVVCAVGDNGSDTCQGDSGVPLMMPYGPDSKYYLYGVSSFGVPCGGGSASVYTRVSEYMDWILSNLK